MVLRLDERKREKNAAFDRISSIDDNTYASHNYIPYGYKVKYQFPFLE